MSLYRCFKKFTTVTQSVSNANIDAGAEKTSLSDYCKQQQQLFREASFFPHEEANMPYDSKVRAWLDLLFAPIEMGAAAAGSSYFFPGTVSDTASEEEKDEPGESPGCDRRPSPGDDEVAREQREWRACTRASINKYRHEPESEFRILTPRSLPSEWQERHLRQLRKVSKDLSRSQTEPRQQLDYSQRQRQHQLYHQQLDSSYLPMPQDIIAVVAAENPPGNRQGLMQFSSGDVYYSTELNMPLKRTRFGSLGITETHPAGQQRKRPAYHEPMANPTLHRIE